MTVERRPITDRAQWLEWRQRDVTASDVAPVLGLHPDRSIAKVWAEKTGVISPEPATEFLEYRLSLEAAAIDWLQKKRPDWDIRRGGVYLRDPELRLAATPDAVATAPQRSSLGVIECKSVIRHVFDRDWKQLEGDLCEAPIWHQIQCLVGMMLVGAGWGVVVALVLDNAGTGALRLSPVERNEDAEARIKEGVTRFWAMIEVGKQPPFDYGLDGEVIAALFPKARIKDPPIDLSADNRLPRILARRARLKRFHKTIEAGCEAIDAEIKDKLGEHELGLLPGWRLSWKSQKRPERIMPAWEGRVLRVTATKDTQ